ncbi:MAG: tandem-95 repeat protein [Herpetosiphon sp.]|nr:tandem-95 repeat protein [Herpetosiphon sp.]
MFRVRLVSLFMLIATLFSTLSVSAQQPVQSQPTAVQQSTVAGDENWDDRFGFPLSSPSFDGGYQQMGVTSSVEFQGELYVGGHFTLPDSAGASIYSLARWNGRRWTSVGFEYRWSWMLIQNLIVHNGQLYVVGSFYPDGALQIARWDGTTWHDVATLSGYDRIYDVESYNGDLYIAGRFSGINTHTKSIYVNNIARWDGTEWHDVAGGITGYDTQVYALTIGNDGLYAGGYFTQAGSVTAKNLARWNGTTWSALGQSSIVERANPVYGLAFHNNQLYVSLNNPDTALHQTLRWNGTTWQMMKHGDSEISLVRVVGQNLYVGTPYRVSTDLFLKIYRSDGIPIGAMVADFKIHGSLWPQPYTLDFTMYQGSLHAAGSIISYDDLRTTTNVMRLENDGWRGLGQGMMWEYYDNRTFPYYAELTYVGDRVTLNVPYHETFYAGTAYGQSLSFNGSEWISEHTSNIDYFKAFAYDGTTTYSAVDTIDGSKVYRRNGSQWVVLPGTFNGEIQEMAAADGNLYVAGYFTKIDTMPVNHIAKWDGTQWSAIGTGIAGNPYFYDLVVAGNTIYAVGSDLQSPQPLEYNDFIWWNGTQWQNSISLNSPIRRIAIDQQGILYGVASDSIIKFSNGQWSLVATANSWISDIVFDGSTLYVAGSFNQIGGVSARGVVKYANGQWSMLGSGTNYSVSSLAVDDLHRLYMFGEFTEAGGKASLHFAIWHPNGIPNTNPVAVADFVTTVRNQAINIAVLTNDYDLDGDMLALASLTQPAHGTAVMSGTNVIYSPTTNYTGTDTFMYTVSDGRGGTSSANVTIMITKSLNHAPTAINDGAVTAFQTPVTIAVLSNDTDLDADTLSITSVTQPMHGTAVISGTSVVYTPALGYIGNDSFSYTISDGRGGTSTAMVMILVDGPPQYRVYLPMITR